MSIDEASSSVPLAEEFKEGLELTRTWALTSIESFTADPGDPYRTGEHHAISVLQTDDPERDGTLADVVAVGFRERAQGRVRRPLQARFYRYRAAVEAGGHPDQEKPATE